jgi:hypothetical protein
MAAPKRPNESKNWSWPLPCDGCQFRIDIASISRLRSTGSTAARAAGTVPAAASQGGRTIARDGLMQ